MAAGDQIPAGNQIRVSGAREHNLKDISLVLPRDALVVITGLSGSGKSSLAFDTIYAEGQRRYVESLSAYARQFLGQMDKPDVDSIEGLSPAISIDQKTTSRNPRSTVGTVTEIYDYLRLLWARVGKPHCPICGRPIVGQSAEQIIDQVMELAEGTRFMVLAPVVRGRKGEYGKLLDELRADGFARVKIDDRVRMLEESIVLDKRYKHDISVVVDRLVMRHDLRKRLADSIETAVQRADGLVEIEIVGAGKDGDATEGGAHATGAKGTRAPSGQIRPGEVPTPGTVFTFSERFACPEHGPSLIELEPRIFSFNSPHGACDRCTGLGSQMEIDPELVVPDPSLSIGEGALAPWASSASNYYAQMTEAIAEEYGVDLDAPWEELPEEQRDVFLYGTGGEPIQVTYRNRFGRRRSYAARFEGIVPNLQRRYRETDSEWSREKIEEYMSLRACPECGGARLRPESRAVLVAGTRIEDFTALSARRALQWLEEVELSETDRHVARLILREISERLRFLDNVGIGYLSMDRAAATLSGGEAQRIRLATQIGSSLVGVLYILDEPSIGLHQRDNSKLIATLERLRDLGNTVIVVEHDEQTMRAADHLVDLGPGRRRARRAGSWRRAPPPRSSACRSRSPASTSRAPRTIETPDAAADPERLHRDPRRQPAQPPRHRRPRPARGADVRHRRLRVGQVDARQRRPLQGRRQPPAPRPAAPRQPPRDPRPRAARQDHRRRPVPDRAHAALEPGHLHGPVRRDPRPVLQDPGGARARLQAGALQLQRQGRALRGLPRRRPDQDRDALPARRVRALRTVPRQALQPRDARGPLQGPQHRRRARHAGRGGAALLRAHPEGAPAPGDARRRRASATCASASPPRRSPAARPSA